jgi:hypothetical protein
MDREKDRPDLESKKAGGILAGLLGSILRDIVKLVVIFALGTLGGAAICLYYGFPLIYSFAGGIAIFAIAVAAFIAS